MLKIIPNKEKWNNNDELYFLVGINPKNDRVYIRAVRRTKYENDEYLVEEYKRILLSNFNNTSYGLIIYHDKLTPTPKHVKSFLYRISKNKEAIKRAIHFGIEELIL